MISGSIVLYKTEIPMVSEVIHSFFRGDSQDRKLFLIDNSPTDELHSLDQLYPGKIEYIFMNRNAGYGASHNVGIKKSIDGGFQYHVVLNPDLSFDGNTLPGLVNFMDVNENVGLCMPDIWDYYDNRRRFGIKLLPTPMNVFVRGFLPKSSFTSRLDEKYMLKKADYSKVIDAPFLSGCFMFFRNSVFKEIGFFDENIFMYFEDTDISRRVYRKFRTCYVPFVRAKHVAEKATYKSRKMFWITVKSAIYYFNKYGWLFDRERAKINKKVLSQIGY